MLTYPSEQAILSKSVSFRDAGDGANKIVYHSVILQYEMTGF